MYDETLWYAGTLDLFGDLPGCIDVQIDIKSGAIPRSVGPQTAAYSNGLYVRAGIMTRKRFALKLEAGKYSLIQLDRSDDFDAFCRALKQFSEG